MARRLLILALLIGGAIALSHVARDAIGIDASSDSVQSWVSRFGWKAPAAFFGLVALRHVLLLPSSLILTAGGICFGAGLGGALGAAGVVATAVVEFVLLRTVRPRWLLHRVQREAGVVSRVVRGGTPTALFLSTAVPPMPMSAFQWAAAFTPISLPAFVLILSIGAAIRAYALSLLGSGLLAADSIRIAIGVVVLLGLIALALLYRALGKRWFPSG
jgi:uncharacterized membrane protein YdjX (TVP38/TMEM64 family)